MNEEIKKLKEKMIKAGMSTQSVDVMNELEKYMKELERRVEQQPQREVNESLEEIAGANIIVQNVNIFIGDTPPRTELSENKKV